MTRILLFSFIVLFFCTNSLGQYRKVKCVLLGTTHSFKPNPHQNFDQVIAKLTGFKPEIICVESIPLTDTATIQRYRKESFKKARLLQKQFQLMKEQIDDSIEYYTHKTEPEENNIQDHLSLARYLYMANDFKGNSDYQWWIAHFLSRQQQIAISDTLANEYFANNRYNEYYNVVYPVASRLKIKQVFPVDDQYFYPDDIKAQKKAPIRLLFSFKGLKALKLIKSLKTEFTDYDKQGRLFELLNDSVYQNRISDLIINVYPEWSKSKWAKHVAELWKKRNKRIAETIIKTINNNPDAERVLITFGAAHIPLLRLYLSQYPTIEIIDYNNLPD